MARTPLGSRRTRRPRQGLIDTLLDDASEIVQAVAIEFTPGIVGAIDVDDLVQRIDVQAILEKVDLERLLAEVDLNAVLQRVDIDALLQQVDIDALLERTELGALMARSGSAMLSRGVDAVRSQGVGLDGFIHRWVDRLLRRGASPRAVGPGLALAAPDPPS